MWLVIVSVCARDVDRYGVNPKSRPLLSTVISRQEASVGSMKYSCAGAAVTRDVSPVRVRGFWIAATEVARVPASPT